MFLVDLPNPAIRIEHVPNTIDNSMPGGHATVAIDNLRVPASQMLGEAGEGFQYAQIRLAPARLSHCMRWLGACIRANEIAADYACRRQAFGKVLIDHEGVGFMLAENLIDQLQELMPELKEVSPWHSVGQRRGLDEVGRIAEQPISDEMLYGDLD